MRDKSSFPPGPYHVIGSGPRIRSVKAAGRTIAQILLSPRREAECEALGRLFVAAPKMYEALKTAEDVIACELSLLKESYLPNPGKEEAEDIAEVETALALIRAAIAEVERQS